MTEKIKTAHIKDENELFCFWAAQHHLETLYLGYYILGMNMPPQSYRELLESEYGLEFKSNVQKRIELSREINPKPVRKWVKFTLAEFNDVGAERGKTVPGEIFARVAPPAWKKLNGLLLGIWAAYAKVKNAILELNMPLVLSILNGAVKHRHLEGAIDMDDATSEAYIGASRAIDCYVMDKGKPSTIMMYKVTQAVKEFLDKYASAIKTSGSVQQSKRKICKFIEEYRERHGCDPSTMEIMSSLKNIPRNMIEAIKDVDFNNLVSLDAPLGDDSDAASLHEILPDVYSSERRHRGIAGGLEILMDGLSDRERAIIMYRYKLESDEIITYEGIYTLAEKTLDAVRTMCSKTSADSYRILSAE